MDRGYYFIFSITSIFYKTVKPVSLVVLTKVCDTDKIHRSQPPYADYDKNRHKKVELINSKTLELSRVILVSQIITDSLDLFMKFHSNTHLSPIILASTTFLFAESNDFSPVIFTVF